MAQGERPGVRVISTWQPSTCVTSRASANATILRRLSVNAGVSCTYNRPG